jgi:hypothetical protein
VDSILSERCYGGTPTGPPFGPAFIKGLSLE